MLVFAGSTTTSIRHTHELGGVPHAHGFGLTHGYHAAATPNRHAAFQLNGLASQHNHLIVFGFELYGGESPSAPGSAPFGEPCGVQVALGVGAVTGDDPLPDEYPGPPAAILFNPTLDVSSLFAVSPPPVACAAPIESARWTVCDCARGERSGVSHI